MSRKVLVVVVVDVVVFVIVVIVAVVIDVIVVVVIVVNVNDSSLCLKLSGSFSGRARFDDQSKFGQLHDKALEQTCSGNFTLALRGHFPEQKSLNDGITGNYWPKVERGSLFTIRQ